LRLAPLHNLLKGLLLLLCLFLCLLLLLSVLLRRDFFLPAAIDLIFNIFLEVLDFLDAQLIHVELNELAILLILLHGFPFFIVGSVVVQGLVLLGRHQHAKHRELVHV